MIRPNHEQQPVSDPSHERGFMRRNVPSGIDDFGPQDAGAEAHKSGPGLDDLIAAALAERARQVAPPRPRRPADNGLEGAIARINDATRRRPNRDLDAILAAAAAEEQREAAQQAGRTAAALDSIAAWIETAETRLSETSRAATEQQDQIASALTEALGAIRERLDGIEQQVNAQYPTLMESIRERLDGIERQAQHRPEVPRPLAEALAGLQADVTRLNQRVDAPQPDRWSPALDGIEQDIGRLQGTLADLATRDEVATLERSVRLLAAEMTRPRHQEEVKALAGTVADLRSYVHNLSSDLAQGLHQRISSEVDSLTRRLDLIAASGIDRATLEVLNAQVADMRQALGRMADPHRIDALADEVSALGRQIADLRLQQVSASDFAALKGSLEEVRASVRRSEEAATSREIPDQLQSLSKRLDLLMSRPEPIDLEPLTDRIGSLSDQIALLSAQRAEVSAPVSTLVERLSGELRMLTAAATERTEPSAPVAALMTRLADRVDQLAVQQAQSAAPQSAMLERLAAQMGALAARGAEPQGPVADLIARLSSRLQDLSGQAEGLESRLSSRLEDLSGRAEGLEDRLARRVDGVTAETASLAERLSGRLDALASQAGAVPQPFLDRFDRLEDGLRQIGEQADTAPIEIMLRAVHDKLERGAASPGTLDALEDRLEALTRRLAQASAEPVQHALAETLLHVKTLRGEAAMIAERAAKSALKEVQAGEADDLEAIRQGFAELKALQTSADKRTQATLKAVHNALETLVMRGPSAPAAQVLGAADTSPAARLESAVRKLHKVAIAQAEEITSPTNEAPAPKAEPEEVLIEPGAPRHSPIPAPTPQAPAASLASSEEDDPGSVRANFIAAARRATHAASAEIPAKAEGAEGADEAKRPISNQTLIERIRQTFDSHRRPLLLSVALLVLVAGSAQVASLFRSADEPVQAAAAEAAAPALAAAKPANAPAAPESVRVAAESPAADRTASLLEPAPIIPADAAMGQAAAFTKKTEPVVAEDLPQVVPAALRQAAAAGEPAALYELASRLSDGRGLPRDPALAAKLYDKAAQAGLVPAQFRLGSIHDKGTGVARDPAAARAWYERAAASGHVQAMHNLAVLLAEGMEGKPNYAAASRWFLEAAEHGLKDSQYNLGVLLARGLGTPQNLAQSYKWFALAAAQGDEDAKAKRDEVAGRLPAADLPGAKALVAAWRARPTDRAANEVVVPAAQSWSAAAARVPGRS